MARLLKDQSGMSLLETSIAAGIGLLVLAGGVALLNSWQEKSLQLSASAWLAQARNEISISLQDQKTFEATIHRPENAASFDCLLKKNNCRGAGGPIVIQAKAGLRGLTNSKPLLPQIFNPFDASKPNAGLTAKGDPCNEFTTNSAVGSDKCPFRFTANWQAICPGTGNCFDPGIEISVILSYNPTPTSENKMVVNPANFSVVQRKGQAITDTKSLCDSVHGVMQGSVCVTSLAVGCPAGQFILGFTQDSQPYCGYTFGGLNPAAPATMCPVGQVLIGIDSNGLVRCGPGCGDQSGTSNIGNIFPNSSL